MEIDAICEYCGHRFKVNTSVVDKITYKAFDDELLEITSYDCPKCENHHYIQVDNENTRNILGYCEDLLKQLMVYQSKNDTAPKKLRKKFENTRKKLNNARMELMKKYSETDMRNVKTKEVRMIRFSL